MTLSWSHKLFLRINKTLGTRPLLDKIMYFCGQWLIFLLGAITAISVFTKIGRNTGYFNFFVVWGLIFLLAYGISYTIAIAFRHPRPILELPNVKELITPMETWKSFPSDHTIAVTLLTSIAYLYNRAGFGFEIIALGAVLVMAGRVYCGVHYPRDIIGGILVALFSMAFVIGGLAFYFLSHDFS